MKLFNKFPWLFFVLAIVLVANNYFEFDPNQVFPKPWNIIIPGIFILMGALSYFWKWHQNKNQQSK